MTQRTPPARDEAYLAWVRTQPSVVSGQLGCEAHHVISNRYSSAKTSDYLAIPLTTEEHRKLHKNWRAWEKQYGEQRSHSATMLDRAIDEGFPFRSRTNRYVGERHVERRQASARAKKATEKTGHANGASTRSPGKCVKNPLISP